MESFDLIVVGAGVSGLAAAKTYHQIFPSRKLLVLDANDTIGGTWCHARIYEGLASNNLLGNLEYSDLPMDYATFGVQPHEHVPGMVVHEYLTAYAKKFGVFERTRFGAWVRSAELRDKEGVVGGKEWIVEYDTRGDGAEKGPQEWRTMRVRAEKLIMGTGVTSEENMPTIPGMTDFEGEIFHSKELSVRTKEMEAAKNVVVIGGSKSAADAVYVNASKGRHVDWVIRSSGRGPAWLTKIFISPFQISLERLSSTRFMTLLSDCFDQDAYPRVRRLLHNTAIGRALLRGIFTIINKDTIGGADYNAHPETKKLLPRANLYYCGTAVGILNYPTSLFELVRKGMVRVHNEDVVSLSPYKAHLSAGQTLDADVVICATGYKHVPLQNFKFLPEDIQAITGFGPASPESDAVKMADAEIMKRFPQLKTQPTDIGTAGQARKEDKAWRLYRGIVPPAFIESRNLAYIGLTLSLRGFLMAEIQALWIIALLHDKMSTKVPGRDEAEHEALLLSRFWRWRAPNGSGVLGPDMVFEMLPYVDTLLRDLGLETQRKGGWSEIFGYYGHWDYRDLVQEWTQKNGPQKK